MPDELLLMVFWLVTWAGIALLLSNIAWFQRSSLEHRLAPFAPGGRGSQSQAAGSVFRNAWLPLIEPCAAKFATALGVRGTLEARLQRARAGEDVAAFRSRQFGWVAAGAAVGLLATMAVRPPSVIAILFILGTPVLAFLMLEQQLTTAVKNRRERLFTELPIVTEQLAMLLSAGYSLGSALTRLADRGNGAIFEDLREVRERIGHGVPPVAALNEWATTADVPELYRLVAVLSVSSETNDLGRLVSEEARSARREAQRRLAETIDRRAQQVWVPVTVATLIPGVIFLTIPFLQALRLFSAT